MKLSCIGHRQSPLERILERIERYNECLSVIIDHVDTETNQALLLRKVLSKTLLWVKEAKAILYKATGVVESAKNNSSSLNSADLEILEDRMKVVLRKSRDVPGLIQLRMLLQMDVDGVLKSRDVPGLKKLLMLLQMDVDGVLKRRKEEPKTEAADKLKPLNKKGKTKAADRLKPLNKKEMKEMPSEINKANKTLHVPDLGPTVKTAETEVPLQRNEAKNLNLIPSSLIQPEAEPESKHEIRVSRSASSIETNVMPEMSHPLRGELLSTEKIKIESISSKSGGMLSNFGEIESISSKAAPFVKEGVPPAQERLAEEIMKAGDTLKMPHLKQEIEEVTFGENKAKRVHVTELNPVLSVLEGEAEHEAIYFTRSESASISELVDESTSTSKIAETEVLPLGRNEALSTDFDVHESVPRDEDEKKFNLLTEIEEMPFDRNEAITVDVTGLTKTTPGLSVQDNLVSSSALENEWRPAMEIAESSISSKSEGMLSFNGEENVDKIPSGTRGFRFIHETEVENIASEAEFEGRIKPEQSEISVEPTVIETSSVKVKWPQFMDTELEIFQGDSSMKVQDVIKDRGNLLREADYYLSIRTGERIEGSPKTGSDRSNIFKDDASLFGPLEITERTPGHSILDRAGAGLKEPPPETEWEYPSMVGLAGNEFSSLPEKPHCPNLRFLFLQRNNRLRTIPDLFFDGMASLRVLDLSKTRITSLPPSLFKLTELQVLFLRECDCLDELPHEVGDLQHMEVLDLWGTELYNLPDDIGKLIFLKILQVSFYGSDDQSEYRNLPPKLVSDDIVSKFVALQALSIAVHPKDRRWNKSADAITKNMCMLNNLTYLEFYFPEVKFLSHFIKSSPSWSNRQLKFKFVVGQNIKRIVSHVPEYIESEYNHQDRCLKFVNGGEKPQEVVFEVLNRATGFYLDHHLAICKLSEFGISNMEGLEFCLVRECPNIRVVIDSEERSERVLPSLRHLSIHYLWELEIIWKGPVTNGSLGVLKVLSVHTCPKLEFIISQSMLQGLSKLEELVVEDCVSLKEIIRWDGNLVEDDFNVLPGLKKIKLHYLPELVKTSLWNGDFPLLKPDIYGCPKLEGLSRLSVSRSEEV